MGLEVVYKLKNQRSLIFDLKERTFHGNKTDRVNFINLLKKNFNDKNGEFKANTTERVEELEGESKSISDSERGEYDKD